MIKKIDLHIHTNDKEGTKLKSNKANKDRNINVSDFVSKMKEKNIGIASITNHDHFDEEFFLKASKELKGYTELLPGIEINLYTQKKDDLRRSQKSDDLKRLQMNIIYPIEEIDNFKKAVNLYIEEHKKIENLENSEKISSFNIYKIIEIFDNQKAMFLIDVKNNEKTSWRKYEDLEQKLKNESKALVLKDVAQTSFYTILSSTNINALVGSDVKNWEEYNYKNNLLDYDSEIGLNFNGLVSILKGDRTKIDEIINIKTKKNKKIQLKDLKKRKYLEENPEISLYKGLNILYGKKSSGKSTILEDIKNSTDNSYFYDVKEFDKKCKMITDVKHYRGTQTTTSVKYKEELAEIGKFVEKIKNYKRIKSWEVSDLIEYLNQPSNQYNLFLENIVISQNFLTPPDEVEAFKNTIVSIKKTLKKDFKDAEFKEIVEKIKESLSHSQKILKGKYKDYFLNKFKQNLKDKFSDIQLEIKGVKNLPKLNLYNEALNRISFFKIIEEFDKKWKVPIDINVHDLLINNQRIKIDFKIELDRASKKEGISNIMEIFKNLDGKKQLKDWSKILNFEKSNLEEYKNFLKSKIEKSINEAPIKKFSSGQFQTIFLNECFQEKSDIILIDEPETYLDMDTISGWLFQETKKLILSGKYIAFATHNPIIGINFVPQQYIECFSKKKDEKESKEINYGFNNFTLFDGNKEMKNKLIINFDGDEKNFMFRKGYYEK